MPKYIPTDEYSYKITSCPICGGDALDQETCSDLCEQQWIIFKEDLCESQMMKDSEEM